MKYFVLIWLWLVSNTCYAKSPCQPPPNRATAVVSEGKDETRSDTVVLTQADYARLYEFYNRCLLAKSGTASDWQLFLRRADEAERAVTVNLEHQPLLDHLSEVETTRQAVKAVVADSSAVLTQLRELEQLVTELQTRVAALSAQPQTAAVSPPTDTEALAAAK